MVCCTGIAATVEKRIQRFSAGNAFWMAGSMTAMSGVRTRMQAGLRALMILGGIFTLLLGGGWCVASEKAAAGHDPEVALGGRIHGKPGPWGQIEYVRMTIERPDWVVPQFPPTNAPTKWFFAGMDAAKFASLLERLPVTQAQKLGLLEKPRLATTSEGLWVVPPREVILGLNPEARGVIYRMLADHPANDSQRNPHTFLSESASEWFRNCRLPQTTIELISGLLYRRGHALCFSDLADVLPLIPDDLGRLRLWRTLSREATVLMKLRVTPESNVEQLVSYWGRGGKGTSLRPFIESLARVESGALVDISHFLPRFARDRLYAYPRPTDPRAGSYDCFWSAMNFFSDEPNMAYLELKRWEAALKEFYGPATGEPTLGDLVFLLNPEGGAFHAAVYIADNVVFSKNGASYSEPWILMPLPDMVAFYEAERPVRIVYKRKKADLVVPTPQVEVKPAGR